MGIFILWVSNNVIRRGSRRKIFVCIGSGDPSLGSPRWNETKGETIMQHWLSLIAGKGIKQCRGIILDLSAWPGQTQTVPDGYPWGDLG
jgi:D-alanyl-D-alanine carboxypeptidase/D-alanyl-D-alanine-endopeptidase (penicillin-binding protein 4)